MNSAENFKPHQEEVKEEGQDGAEIVDMSSLAKPENATETEQENPENDNLTPPENPDGHMETEEIPQTNLEGERRERIEQLKGEIRGITPESKPEDKNSDSSGININNQISLNQSMNGGGGGIEKKEAPKKKRGLLARLIMAIFNISD